MFCGNSNVSKVDLGRAILLFPWRIVSDRPILKSFGKIYYQVINVLIVGNDSTHRLEIVFEGLYVKKLKAEINLSIEFPLGTTISIQKM